MTAGTFLIWMGVWVWGSRVPNGALSLGHFPGYLYVGSFSIHSFPPSKPHWLDNAVTGLAVLYHGTALLSAFSAA